MTFHVIPIPLSFREAYPARRRDAEIVDPRTHIDEHLRPMRAFARCLTRDGALGDTLVCDTVRKAWASCDTFEPGTNVAVWLFSIERNIFYTQRKSPADCIPGDRLAVSPDREGISELARFRRAFDSLPDEQREALTLTGAAGFSPGQAAEICGRSVDVLKNRAIRGRRRLAKILTPKQTDQGSGTARVGVIGRNT